MSLRSSQHGFESRPARLTKLLENLGARLFVHGRPLHDFFNPSLPGLGGLGPGDPADVLVPVAVGEALEVGPGLFIRH